jgi:hypothetical protein
MSQIIEDALTSKLAEWIDSNRPDEFPASVPVHVANRDEVRTRPCIVLDAPESKRVPAPPNTSRVKLDVHLFTQIDDTGSADHAAMAKALSDLLADRGMIKTALNSSTFILHALMLRESSTSPDESRGRESVITYEAIASAV